MQHELAESAGAVRALGRAELARYIRARLPLHLYEEAPSRAEGVAIYLLADPRDLRAARYIGQTSTPRRRLLQHLGAARLWLPDETPWWVPVAKLRPLYEWIRALFAEERRLPVMVVLDWVEKRHARAAERAHIQAALAAQAMLLNYETELLRSQLPLPLSVPELQKSMSWPTPAASACSRM
jgi:hypothetical protein